MATATEPLNEIPITESGPIAPEERPKKRFDEWNQRISACKQYRKKLITNWTINIDYRRGKPFASQTDEDRVVVPLDWSLTKAKQASLFSQTPQVHVDHAPATQTAGPWLFAFEQRLNDTVVTAGIEAAMDEAIVDCINAAGIGAVLVSHESISEDKQLPSVSPETAAQMQAMGQEVPMQVVPQVHDHRYVISRISPADLLWPINFTGSDFDQAPWIGRTGRISWAQAVQWFKLTEDDKSVILGEERSTLDRLTHDIDKDKTVADELVSFDEVFYKEYCFDEMARSYVAIHHLIFVTGKEEPVVDEGWKGQLVAPDQPIIGAQRYPIRVLTLSYLTDETIPPSDSAMGRPQVNEINKSRTQMILQRERSIPIRTANVNLIDPTILQNLMRGTWQSIIPVQSNAEVIREVSRASHPPENFTFDKIAKADLGEVWQVGANQMGSGQGIETKGEAEVVQQDFTTRIGRERAKVSKFFVSVTEVLGGLLCLYEDAQSFGDGFDPSVSRTLNYSILADSTVLLDSNQRLQRLIQFVNFSAKSGWVDIEPVLKEIAQLSGLDPNTVIKPPLPKPPAEPNISLRLTGAEDMMNPLLLAFMMKSGQAPAAELIQQAMQLIALAMTQPPNAMVPRQPPMGPDGMPLPPVTPDQAGGGGQPLPPGTLPPPQPMPLAAGVPHMAVPPPLPPPPQVGAAHPNWSAMDKLNKRTETT